jgi:FkbM family methyltransferase
MRAGVLAFSPVVGAELLLDASTAPITHVQVGDLVRGELETPVQEAFRRRLTAGDVGFDVGANVGFLSLVAGAIVGPTGRVVAWEPVPASADAVRRNAAVNGMDWVEVREAAVGAEPGTQTLLEVDEQSWSHLADRGRHPRTNVEREVRVEALDPLVASGELPPPPLVKIDVEGSEVAVLPGMRRSSRSTGPTWSSSCTPRTTRSPTCSSRWATRSRTSTARRPSARPGPCTCSPRRAETDLRPKRYCGRRLTVGRCARWPVCHCSSVPCSSSAPPARRPSTRPR